MRKKTITNYGKKKLDESLRLVCLFWDVSESDVLGKSRFQNIINAKHSLRYLLSRDKKINLAEVGALTNCDHTTVLHSIKIFETHSQREVDFNEFKGIIDGVLKYKKHSSLESRVSEIINSKISTKLKVKELNRVYYENR